MFKQYSLAVVQPDVPSPQPGSVVLVLVGHEVVDESGDSWFEGVSVLVGAVPTQSNSTRKHRRHTQSGERERERVLAFDDFHSCTVFWATDNYLNVQKEVYTAVQYWKSQSLIINNPIVLIQR